MTYLEFWMAPDRILLNC